LLKLLRNHVEEKTNMYIETMKTGRTFSLPVLLVAMAMAIILPVLAYMQYIWLGQVSEQEFRQMQENVRTASFHCSMAFSQEITGLITALSGELHGSEIEVRNELHTRILKWKSSTTHPTLILPEIKLTLIPSPEQSIRINRDENSEVFLSKDLSSFAVPLENIPGQAACITLDTLGIRSSFIPEMIQAYLSPTVRAEYDIAVYNNTGNVLYTSKAALPNMHVDHPDVVIPFLFFHPTPPPSMPFDRMNRDEFLPGRDHQPAPFIQHPPGSERRDQLASPPNIAPPDERGMGYDRNALLTLTLTHHAGSLEIAVQKNRIRNLALSFGILLLLGASMIFLLLSANRAQQLARQQLEFVASVSHELRTPLAVVKSAGENLADGVIQDQEKLRKYGELIKKEVLRLSYMVEKALAYAGIQSGKQIYDLSPIHITDILTRTIRATKKLIPQDHSIELSITEHLPNISGNSAALQSAFENLLLNAVKYSGEQRWTGVEARLTRLSKQPAVEIIVKDHGIGIAAGDLAHIFEPFYRGQNAIDKQIEGSGLGLSITKHIVEAHGGTLSVKSSPNIGTMFIVQLPAAGNDRGRS